MQRIPSLIISKLQRLHQKMSKSGVPFNVTECRFNVVECRFNVAEYTFNVAERNFLLGVDIYLIEENTN